MKQDFALLAFLYVNLGGRNQARVLYYYPCIIFKEKQQMLKSLEITAVYHLSCPKASF